MPRIIDDIDVCHCIFPSIIEDDDRQFTIGRLKLIADKVAFLSLDSSREKISFVSRFMVDDGKTLITCVSKHPHHDLFDREEIAEFRGTDSPMPGK